MSIDFSKNLAQGRKVAHSMKKNKVLITAWIDEELKEEVYKKCPNVSAFITECFKKLAKSPIDKQIKDIYKGIADEVIKEKK